MTELSGEIFRTTGRAAQPLTPVVLRELTPADLAMLDTEKGSTTSHVKRLSQRHHSLARNLASGMSERDAGIICGYSPSRVSILKNDPAFRELLTFYAGEVDLVYQDMHEKLHGIASVALDELQERLEDEPESISVGQLLEVVKIGADRTGHGPQSSTTNVNINVGMADRLQAARDRVSKARTIEGTTNG